MANAVQRAIVDRFFQAYNSRDATKIAALLAEDVEWNICGPVEILAFCGHWRGRDAVLRMFRHLVPKVFRVTQIVQEDLLVDGDRAAALSKLTSVQPETGRVISYRVTHFLLFSEGQLIRCRSVIDSYDAAEQVLGHRLDVVPGPELDPVMMHGDRIAI